MELKRKPEDFIVHEVPSFSLTPSGTYHIYEMTKRNRTTEDVVQALARSLDIPRNQLGYAGTKDKRAVTTQYISIHNRQADVSLRDVTLTYIGPSNGPLTLGSHVGNTFTIRVYDCDSCTARPTMINYFGEQRFSTNNADVGKALIRERFDTACESIVDAGGKNAAVINNYLADHPNDYLGAVQQLPFKIVSLYAHAYQSKLWNEAVDAVLDAEVEMVPLIGFGTRFDDSTVEAVYADIMEREEINLRDFVVRSWPKLSQEGTHRRVRVPLDDLTIEDDGDAYVVSFTLPPGSYATVAVTQLCGP